MNSAQYSLNFISLFIIKSFNTLCVTKFVICLLIDTPLPKCKKIRPFLKGPPLPSSMISLFSFLQIVILSIFKNHPLLLYHSRLNEQYTVKHPHVKGNGFIPLFTSYTHMHTSYLSFFTLSLSQDEWSLRVWWGGKEGKKLFISNHVLCIIVIQFIIYQFLWNNYIIHL